MHAIQAPAAVVMIRPHHFQPNPQTAADNSFQCRTLNASEQEIATRALNEVDAAADALQAAGVTVHVFDDCSNQETPDSVFPNNWFSTHAGGHIAVYPMYCPNRRRERRSDVLDLLKAQYRVQDVIDYSGLEQDGLFLEGTGAMVLDHAERVAYTVQSNRANPVALERFCTHFNYEPMAFAAHDAAGQAIYHTNVLMCIGSQFVMMGLASVPDLARRAEIKTRLLQSGRELVELTAQQLAEYAGNALELSTPSGPLLAISSRALASLCGEQIKAIERYASILPLAVPTIELAGGSVRCMLAGIHLARR